jgi:hypothetical protein
LQSGYISSGNQSARLNNCFKQEAVNHLFSSSELELRIMNEIIIVLLVIGLVVLSTYLFVIEPRSKFHDTHDL